MPLGCQQMVSWTSKQCHLLKDGQEYSGPPAVSQFTRIVTNSYVNPSNHYRRLIHRSPGLAGGIVPNSLEHDIIYNEGPSSDCPTTNFSCCTHAKSLISHISLFHHALYFFVHIRSLSLHILILLSLYSLVLHASTICFHNTFHPKTTSLWLHSSQKYIHQYVVRQSFTDAHFCVCFHYSSSLFFILELLHCFLCHHLGQVKVQNHVIFTEVLKIMHVGTIIATKIFPLVWHGYTWEKMFPGNSVLSV